MARICVAVVLLASCAARAPAPIDVDALLTARGPLEARRELQIRAIGEPRDVAPRLALAALDERIGRPSEAIDALEAVVALGGPLGVRWQPEDRARLARLIAARGRARLARGAASALTDLARARDLGAPVAEDQLRGARVARAILALRHSDARTRDGGRRALALAGGVDEWLGAHAGASPEQRGRFGAWLWQRGARRAAWDELSAWRAATHPPREPALQGAYLLAARWWIPLDRAGPAVADLVGPARCAFGACAPHEVAGDEAAERAYLLAPPPAVVRDPVDAAALAAITLRQALRGDGSWGEALAARVDLAAFRDPAQLAKLPRHVQPMFARLLGRDAPIPGDGTTPDERLVLGAARVLAGAGPAEIDSLVAGVPYSDELRRIAAPRAPFAGDAFAQAAARHAELAVRGVSAAVPGAARADALRDMVVAYRRDPLIADRLGRDAVAGAVDAAAMHATLGALFDALGDPARARASWQAAVDASPEPDFVRGLAEAEARQGDADAALITATSAAAASGDPAVVWSCIARALAGAGKYVHALEAARSAIDLSGPETLPGALVVAISASRALGRDAQAASLAQQLARSAPATGERADDPTVAPTATADSDPDDVRARASDDPTAARAALAAFRRSASSATISRMWVAARWNPRDVELRAALLAALPTDDARRAVLAGELVDLAADRDPELRRAAVAALR